MLRAHDLDDEARTEEERIGFSFCLTRRRGHTDRLAWWIPEWFWCLWRCWVGRTGRDHATHPQWMIPKSVARPAVASAWSGGRGTVRVISRWSAVAASRGKADPGAG